jgi:hypothetical protein
VNRTRNHPRKERAVRHSVPGTPAIGYEHETLDQPKIDKFKSLSAGKTLQVLSIRVGVSQVQPRELSVA